MPPSPRITARLDEPKFALLCESLGLKAAPTVQIRTAASSDGGIRTLGEYHGYENVVKLFIGFSSDNLEKLRFLQGKLTITFLHEMRHAWQTQQWGHEAMAKARNEPYHVRRSEVDANSFAEANAHLWRNVIRVVRTQHNSNFSRLARHTRVV
ncbi:MAG: hypothetical protein H0U53_10990 [Actinobacteria bacterium]|nr:hypothetical protein [Actinomycetota bacterium]